MVASGDETEKTLDFKIIRDSSQQQASQIWNFYFISYRSSTQSYAEFATMLLQVRIQN